MNHAETKSVLGTVSRRDFLRSTALAGAGFVLAPTILGAEENKADKELNIGFIGVGTEGQILLQNALKIPGLKFIAVCDIWPYNQGRAVRLLKKYKHEAKGYADYQEMLDTEKTLDGVLIATPDWVHAPITIAALKAGKHVYCEKEMSNSIELAKQMVVAAKETKRLLQIGHQRRSNPRYHAALDLATKKNCCGTITYVEGQWNRAKRLDVGWPKDSDLDEATLKKYGYDTMAKFRNWRWYKKFAGGPIADLGSHQIDIFNWFLGASPRAVMADGGVDNYEGIEWYDNISAIYEWNVARGGKTRVVRGFYKVISTSSNGGYAETFLGDEGSLIISENDKQGGIRREQEAPMADWEKEMAKAAEAAKPAAKAEPAKEAAPKKEGEAKKEGDADVEVAAHTGFSPGRYYPAITVPGFNKSEHLPHIENFVAALRTGSPLSCPAEVGYDTCVSVLRVNEAVEAQKRIELKPEEFKA
jgi:predicted dehydrogenase